MIRACSELVGGRAARAAAITALGGALLLNAACETHPKPNTALIQAPASCQDETISIYFEPRSAAITHAAWAVLDAAIANARRCRILGIEVQGLTDAVGTPAANMVLSKQRADAVTRALVKRGFQKAPVTMIPLGALGADTPSGDNKPMRRRADITFHLAAP